LNAWPAAKAVNRGLIFFFLLMGRVCFDFSFDFDEFFNFCSRRAIEQRGNVFSLKSYLDFVLIFQKRQITIIVGEGGHIIIMVCGSVMFLVNSRIGTQPSFKFPFINIRRESLFLLWIVFQNFSSFQQHTQRFFSF